MSIWRHLVSDLDFLPKPIPDGNMISPTQGSNLDPCLLNKGTQGVCKTVFFWKQAKSTIDPLCNKCKVIKSNLEVTKIILFLF